MNCCDYNCDQGRNCPVRQTKVTLENCLVLQQKQSWLDKLFDWFTPEMPPVDENCPNCRGIGYDASGYICTCIKENK